MVASSAEVGINKNILNTVKEFADTSKLYHGVVTMTHSRFAALGGATVN